MTTADDVKRYLTSAIKSFDGDPPDSEFTRGYLAALEAMHDDLFLTTAQRAAKHKGR